MKRLFVRPEHRGTGIGRALCKHLISAATDAVEYKCNVYDGNEVSTGLFESLGFQFVARNGILPVGHAELTTGPTTMSKRDGDRHRKQSVKTSSNQNNSSIGGSARVHP